MYKASFIFSLSSRREAPLFSHLVLWSHACHLLEAATTTHDIPGSRESLWAAPEAAPRCTLQTTGQLKVRLANAIRWRNVQQPDGSTTRESNARFVRWSDGSLQVRIESVIPP